MVERIDAKLTFAIGGASSGKSSFAEGLATGMERRRIYIATAQAYDAEMEAKIAAHMASRGPDWITVEAPFDVAGTLADVPADHVVVIDCLTLWLSNLLLTGADLAAASTTLRRAMTVCRAPIVAVSNEVGQGIVPETALGRRFRAAQGLLNQQVAAQADRVAYVVAGLPLWLKGGP
jgi:adenosylcobinamide kinase/adenosylcobinamide-phosphate guanylyltransferase